MHPSRRENLTIRELVRRSIGGLTPAERKVARVLLAAYPVAGLERVARLAERAQVSGPSVVRFVNKLGFAGYPEFQEALREELRATTSSPLTLYEQRPAPSDPDDVLSMCLPVFARNLDATFHGIPPSEFEAVVDLLADPSRRILCTGGRFSQTLAYYLHAHLHMLRPGTRLIGFGLKPRVDDLIDVGRKDVLVVFDYRRYQTDTIELARAAAARGATIVLMTDPWLSPIAGVAKHVLPASVEAPSPFDSLVGATAVVEALVAGLAARMGDAARDRLKELERLRARFAWGETQEERPEEE
jgi:DNA-binding MurR/RpiR family transcriptional regulator